LLFGEINDGWMILNEIGAMVEREWLDSALIRVELDLHSFVVMLNHPHGLLTMTPADPERSADDGKDALWEPGACHAPLRREPRSLGSFVTGFKAATTRQFRLITGERGSLWQRGFSEHLVRDERDFGRIGGYIANNPANWATDPDSDKPLS
jgi:putative transposase